MPQTIRSSSVAYPMDDDVSEPDDAIDVADSRSCLWIDATQSIQRLANDLELSLHSGAKKLITFIVWKRLPCGEPSDALMTGDRTHFGKLYGTTIEGVTIHSPRSLADAVLR